MTLLVSLITGGLSGNRNILPKVANRNRPKMRINQTQIPLLPTNSPVTWWSRRSRWMKPPVLTKLKRSQRFSRGLKTVLPLRRFMTPATSQWWFLPLLKFQSRVMFLIKFVILVLVSSRWGSRLSMSKFRRGLPIVRPLIPLKLFEEFLPTRNLTFRSRYRCFRVPRLRRSLLTVLKKNSSVRPLKP